MSKTIYAKIEVQDDASKHILDSIAESANTEGVGLGSGRKVLSITELPEPRPNVIMWQRPSLAQQAVIDAAKVWRGWIDDCVKSHIILPEQRGLIVAVDALDAASPDLPPDWGKVNGTDAFDPPVKKYRLKEDARLTDHETIRTQDEIMSHFKEIKPCPTCDGKGGI